MGSTLTALATSLGKTAVRLALEGTEQNGDEIANEVLLNLIKPKTLLNLKKGPNRRGNRAGTSLLLLGL